MTFAYIANPPAKPEDLRDLCALVSACGLVPILPASTVDGPQPDPKLFSVRALQLSSCSTIVVDLRGDVGVGSAWRRELSSALSERDRVTALLDDPQKHDAPVVRVVYTDHYIDLDAPGVSDDDIFRCIPTCTVIDYTYLPLLWVCCDAVHADWSSRGQLSIFGASDWSENIWNMYLKLRQGTFLRGALNP